MFTLGSELPVLQILAVTTLEAKTSNEPHHPPPRVGSFYSFLGIVVNIKAPLHSGHCFSARFRIHGSYA